MWNALFATSFKYTTPHLEVDMEVPGWLYLKTCSLEVLLFMNAWSQAKQALELRDEHSIPKSGLIPHTGNFKRLKMAISNAKFQVREKDLP